MKSPENRIYQAERSEKKRGQAKIQKEKEKDDTTTKIILKSTAAISPKPPRTSSRNKKAISNPVGHH